MRAGRVWIILAVLVLMPVFIVKCVERRQGFSILNVLLVGAKRVDNERMFDELASLVRRDFKIPLPAHAGVVRAATRDEHEFWIELEFPPGSTKAFADGLTASVVGTPSDWSVKVHGPGAVGQLNGPPQWWPRQPWRLPETMVLDRRAKNGGVAPPYTYHWGFDHQRSKVYVWMQCDF